MAPIIWFLLVMMIYVPLFIVGVLINDRRMRKKWIRSDIEREHRWYADKDLSVPQLRQRIQSSLKCYSARWEKRYIEETLDELLGCSSVLPIEEDELLKKYL